MHTLSKLVISVVMLRGRHRGLPVALDRAVLMPSEFLITRVTGAPPPEDQPEGHENEKGDEQDDVYQSVQQDRDELAARMRLRARTISLQIVDSWNGEYVRETQEEVSASSSFAEGISEDGGHATPSLKAGMTSEGSIHT